VQQVQKMSKVKQTIQFLIKTGYVALERVRVIDVYSWEYLQNQKEMTCRNVIKLYADLRYFQTICFHLSHALIYLENSKFTYSCSRPGKTCAFAYVVWCEKCRYKI